MAKKIIVVILFLIGAGAIGGSLYISDQVAQGERKLEKAEKSIDEGKKLFGMTPVTKELGKGVTRSFDKKLDEGKDLIAQYQKLAKRLMIGGIASAILGVVLFVYPSRKKRR